MPPADAVLVLSFGGPEGPGDVLPFLRNVLHGRDVPEARLQAVAEHYLRFGGVSPINAQNGALVAALEQALAAAGRPLPVYLGNRNWRPLLADTLATMRGDGATRVAVFATSVFGSYSGCRQYREDLARASAAVPGGPALHKLRLAYDHPGFITAVADGLRETLDAAGDAEATVWFSAHSIPAAMAAGAPYERQLEVAAHLVAGRCGVRRWEQVFQSRSGPPDQAWLGPDLGERLRRTPPGVTVVICPLGFVSDHMEVRYDLDTEAAALAAERGVRLLRSPTAGTHPAFVDAIVDLVAELDRPGATRRALGPDGPWPDPCPVGCCPPPPRRGAAGAGGRADSPR
ncbi:MAG TPA: ferrochelatase [Acidimicrobiales bacterium]|nr:ferrochelatase [Acidimicrobiales bacterium]